VNTFIESEIDAAFPTAFDRAQRAAARGKQRIHISATKSHPHIYLDVPDNLDDLPGVVRDALKKYYEGYEQLAKTY